MVCIIPARGGSERFPDKNIAELFGQPIINHTIKICQDAEVFSDIFVSTDSVEIAAVANAEILFRPDVLSGDVSETDVLQYHMDNLGITRMCRVYPFACLLTPGRLRVGNFTFITHDYDNVMESVRYSHPPQRAINSNGKYVNPEQIMIRTQDLHLRFHDAGTFMFTTREALNKTLGSRNIGWIEQREIDVQDVDTEQDFELLKLKFMRKSLQCT